MNIGDIAINIISNPYRGKSFPVDHDCENGVLSTDPTLVNYLLNLCPIAQPTSLCEQKTLAESYNVKNLYFKDERSRMRLGSFKALGAAYVIARHAYERAGDAIKDQEHLSTILKGETYICSSAGNHGLSIAAGAKIFGAKAVIYLSRNVPESFATRLEEYGATVVIEGDDYEASLAGAKQAADDNNWFLLSDSSWKGYDGGKMIMEGYLALADEITRQIEEPSHVFLQAGVGGLASAMAKYFRKIWSDDMIIIIVEADFAPCLQASILAGKKTSVGNQISNMGRLDCKEPSDLALQALAEDADYFMTISDDECAEAIKYLDFCNLSTSPSGGAGFAGFHYASIERKVELNAQSRILSIISEAA